LAPGLERGTDELLAGARFQVGAVPARLPPRFAAPGSAWGGGGRGPERDRQRPAARPAAALRLPVLDGFHRLAFGARRARLRSRRRRAGRLLRGRLPAAAGTVPQ